MSTTESEGIEKEGSPGATPAKKPQKGSGDLWWKIGVALVVAAAIVMTVVIKSSKGRRSEERSRSPETALFAPGEVLATVNGEPITLAQLQSELEGLPEQFRSQYTFQKHEFLEELITRKLLLEEAKRLKVEESPVYKEVLSAHSAHAGHEEEALVNALLRTQVLDRIEVSEEEIRGFYKEHRADIPAGVSFDAVKGELRNSALQQKQYEAVERYVSELKGKAEVSRNQDWIEAQKASAADNPLDRALSTGRPVVADLGRGTCIPCKMMKPILQELAEEYKGKAEILIMDIGEYPSLVKRCRVRIIPTQIFYDAGGNEVYRHEGFMPKEGIREQLAKLGVE